VKQLKNNFRIFYFILLLLCWNSSANAQQPETRMDSVEISLLTCSPHEEVYSLYGHTAVRYVDKTTGQDLVFNYGVFNYAAPHFVMRFVFGLTDYELGITPMRPFVKYYEQWGSQIIEQVLNLTNKEKLQITQALSKNLRPENRIYRYNFFYDNCSTRPRNLIENHVDGSVSYEPRTNYKRSFREMIHDKTNHHPWAKMGNDMLLGFNADWNTTQREQEFLPENLMYDFEHATITEGGASRPLVKETRIVLPQGTQIVEEDFPLSPLACFLILLAITLALTAWEIKKKQSLVWLDAVLMLPMGIAGLLLTVMLFSQHPATSTNLQILILNPIHLFFLPAVVMQKKTCYWKVVACLLVLFFAGALLQDYAEGMEILALCLLTRYLSHIRK
jgi:hypothetical protein